MEEVVLLKLGELTVKSGHARAEMERLLLRALGEAVEGCGGASMERERGRIYLRGDVGCLVKVASRVFGVKAAAVSRAAEFKDLDDLARMAVEAWGGAVAGRTFAVRARRVGSHGFTSLDVARRVGEALARAGGSVNLESPELELYVEVRGGRAYLYSGSDVVDGPGGLPLGSQGKALALVSGGVDSPVAAWMAMRRGAHVDVLHCNLGGAATLRAVLEVIKALLSWSYGYDARVLVADCGPLITAIRRGLRPELWGLAFKRALYKLAAAAADRVGALAVVTGESIGQVSSQTLQAIRALERGIEIPILRPLAGMDKEEIVGLARRIGTYEPALRVPEYCAIFSRRPKAWASREEVEAIDLAVHDAVEEAAGEVAVVRKRELGRYAASLPQPEGLTLDEVPRDAVVVDLRSEEDYRRWHLPGAIRADLEDVFDVVERYGRDATYVFYCYQGGMSLDVADRLSRLGYRAYSLSPRALERSAGGVSLHPSAKGQLITGESEV